MSDTTSESTTAGARDPDAVDGSSLASTSLSVPEMDCPSCAGTVQNALAGLDGVESTDARPTAGRLDVAYDPSATSTERIVDAVESAGYDVEEVADENGTTAVEADRPPVWRTSRAVKTGAGGLLLALGLVVGFLVPAYDAAVATALGRSFGVADVLLLCSIVAAGEVILRNGYASLRRLDLDIDFLMSAAILAATGLSIAAPEGVASAVHGEDLFVEAAALAFLFNVAELLEQYSISRARRSLAELFELAPETAVVLRDSEREVVPAEAVAVGERVAVEPGAKVPLDGVVVEGESAVDQSPITGESVPVDKAAGDEVYAGTVNESGYLEVEVTAPSTDTTLARIIELVEGAEAKKTEREQFVERFSSYYTPAVVAVAILTAAVPPLALGGDPITWFVRGISLLVIACPCAFVISTPVSVVSGITSAARNGVLIKGGTHLEAMGEVEAVAFDKTGTLTTGELSVTDVVPLNGNDEADVLRCARGVETRSEHPIGDAIVDHAETATGGDDEREVSAFESITGRGVRADLDGTTHYAGTPGLFRDLGFDLDHVHFTTDGGTVAPRTRSQCEREGCTDLLDEVIPELQAEGKTVVVVGTEDQLEGVIAVADAVRPTARETIERLREQGVTPVMLTGDNEGTARSIAAELGIEEYRAELMPEEKVEAIEELRERYGAVAMVGDGINDAPALATADVGVAMGAAGTDTAIETADVALMGDDVGKVPYLYDLSRTANGVIRQNIWGSLLVKLALAVGIPLGYVSLVVAVLVGDVGMTTGVTGNAMRLSRIAPGER